MTTGGSNKVLIVFLICISQSYTQSIPNLRRVSVSIDCVLETKMTNILKFHPDNEPH